MLLLLRWEILFKHRLWCTRVLILGCDLIFWWNSCRSICNINSRLSNGLHLNLCWFLRFLYIDRLQLLTKNYFYWLTLRLLHIRILILLLLRQLEIFLIWWSLILIAHLLCLLKTMILRLSWDIISINKSYWLVRRNDALIYLRLWLYGSKIQFYCRSLSIG